MFWVFQSAFVFQFYYRLCSLSTQTYSLRYKMPPENELISVKNRACIPTLAVFSILINCWVEKEKYMRILTLFLVLFISVSVYAGDSKAVEQWIDETHRSDRFSSNPLDVDRITLSTFHAIKRSLETLEYSINYSAKIVCDDNFGNIVLTIYDKGLGAKHSGLLSRVRDVLGRTSTENPLFFDLYVELVFPNAPYSDPLFLIPAFGNS